jgi:hypothetical protein
MLLPQPYLPGPPPGNVSIEGDGDMVFFTPEDYAAAQAYVWNHSQRKFVGNLFICSNIKGGTVARDAANDAICLGASEAD